MHKSTVTNTEAATPWGKFPVLPITNAAMANKIIPATAATPKDNRNPFTFRTEHLSPTPFVPAYEGKIEFSTKKEEAF